MAHLITDARSSDINIPKEINRLATDGLSGLLFAAGMDNNNAATHEGVELPKIYMMDNILTDTLRFNHSRLQRPAVLDELGVGEDDYTVFTSNRKALLAGKANPKDMPHAILDKASDRMVLVPLHGRSTAVIAELLGANHPTFRLIRPLPCLQFGYLTTHTCGATTNSGNMAEEAALNNIPRVTSNNYTERIETVEVGSNILVGENACSPGGVVGDMVDDVRKKCAIPDRWDGRSAERIVQMLLEQP